MKKKNWKKIKKNRKEITKKKGQKKRFEKEALKIKLLNTSESMVY